MSKQVKVMLWSMNETRRFAESKREVRSYYRGVYEPKRTYSYDVI